MPETKKVAVIMAGGSGERFWPLSRKSRPKQFLRLIGGSQTLLEQMIEYILPLIPLERIFVATGENQAEGIRKAAPHIPHRNILVEPFKKNTAGCLVYTAASFLARRRDDETELVMAILAADHLILRPEQFRRVVAAALVAAENTDALVTLGITPDRPETGYGYIEIGEKSVNVPGAPDDIQIFPASRFCEKPDCTAASKYISSGRYLWNSGMFFWRLSTFLNELRQAAPDLFHATLEISRALSIGDEERFHRIFREIRDISIDYALMEKAKNVLVIKADFGWDDIGSWDILDRTMPVDENGNVAFGGPVIIDSKNSIIYNEPGPDKRAVAVAGVEGLAVIVSEDAVLVIPKDRAQDVRKIVEELKKRNARQI
ncbi:MAG: sugar phosphate nucleotidyltransferase [Candidatus Latescibacter sp.]|nr:sugar phosphate nucleotidyltransferase [Candidatus Latescibacter sp.]